MWRKRIQRVGKRRQSKSHNISFKSIE
jgi:hypothetical protein